MIYWRGHPLFASNSLVHGFGLESRDKRAKMKICNRRFLGLVFRQNAEEDKGWINYRLDVEHRVLGQSHCFSPTSIESISKQTDYITDWYAGHCAVGEEFLLLYCVFAEWNHASHADNIHEEFPSRGEEYFEVHSLMKPADCQLHFVRNIWIKKMQLF